MTAYGRAQTSTPVGRIVVEIQSVNRKFLDTHLSLPAELQSFDAQLRRWVAESLQRGRISLTVNAVFSGEGPVKVEANIPLARQIVAAWEDIRATTGLNSEPSADAILRMEGVLTTTIELLDEDAYSAPLKEAFDAALQAFQSMQNREGEALESDVRARLKLIRTKVAEMLPLSKGSCERYRIKLMERIQEVAADMDCDDRILREVALYAEKVDIEEELTRLGSHLDQFDLLLKKDEAVGKTLDFLLQELFRETNTIASKASDTKLSHLAVDVKGELERIREQIQNVE